MVIFEIFVKAMPPSLSELKILPSLCFAFKIPDNVTASNNYFEILTVVPQSKMPKRKLNGLNQIIKSGFGNSITFGHLAFRNNNQTVQML